MPEISVPGGALTFPRTACDESFLTSVQKWVELLGEERFLDAFKLTAHDSYYSWTPDLIRSVIAGYGLPHEPGDHEYRVSKISETKNGVSRWEVERWHDAEPSNRIGLVSINLPLDGEWSDLTATFEILQDNNYLILVLNEIHVL